MAVLTHFAKTDNTLRTATAAAELTNYTITWANLTGAGFAAGDDVFIHVGVKIWGTSANNNYQFGVGFGTTFAGRTEDTSSVYQIEPVNTDAGSQYIWFDRKTLVVNENIYFRGQATGSTANYQEFTCRIIKLGNLTSNDFFYAENAPGTATPTAYDTSGAGATVPATGDWLLLASVRFDCLAATLNAQVAIHDGTADRSEIIIESEDTTDFYIVGTMAYRAGLAASTTVRARHLGASGGFTTTHTRIFGLRLDAFEDHAGAHTTNTITHSVLDTYQEFAGFPSYNLTSTGPFVVIGWPIHLYNATTKRAYGRIQIGGSDWPAAGANRQSVSDNKTAARIAPLLSGYNASQTAGTLDIDLDCAEDANISPTYTCVEQVAVAFSLTLASGVTQRTITATLDTAAQKALIAILSLDAVATLPGPTAIAAVNTPATLDVDTTYLVRVRVENSGSVGATAFKWQGRLNVGTWTDITTSSAVVKAIVAASFTNDDDVPEVIGGSGTYEANNDAATEDGSTTLAVSFPAAGAIEFVLAFQIVAADVADEDDVDFRIVQNDGTVLDTYTQIASAIVNKEGLTTRTVITSLEAAAQRQALLATTSLTAAAQTSFTTTATLEAAAQRALSATATLEAAALKALTLTASLAATGSASFTITSTLNAIASLVRTVQATLDAVAQQRLTVTAALDAIAQAQRTAIATLDAVAQKALTATASLDAVAAPPAADISVEFDALAQARFALTATLEARGVLARSLTATLDAAAQARFLATSSLEAKGVLARTLQATLEAAGQARFALTASLDATASQRFTLATTLDVVSSLVRAVTATLEAAGQGRLTATAALDAVAALQVANAITATLEALAQKGLATTAALDAVAAVVRTVTTTFDGVAQKRIAVTAALDAIAQATRTAQATLEALARKQIATTVVFDAIAQAETDDIFAALDAVAQAHLTIAATLEAKGVLVKQIAASLDAAGQRQIAQQATLDAVSALVATVQATLDAVAQKSLAVTASFEALGEFTVVAGELSAALDALAQARLTLAVTLAAVGQTGFQIQGTLDALSRATLSVAATLEAVAQARRTQTASLEAAGRATRTATTTLDALAALVGATQVQATFDAAALQRGFSLTAFFDAAAALAGRTTTATLSAAGALPRTVSASLEALASATLQQTTMFEAAAQKRMTAAATLEARAVLFKTIIAGLDAAAQKAIVVSASFDAAARSAQTATSAFEAAGQTSFAFQASFNSVGALIRSASIDFDAMAQRQGMFASALFDAIVGELKAPLKRQVAVPGMPGDVRVPGYGRGRVIVRVPNQTIH